MRVSLLFSATSLWACMLEMPQVVLGFAPKSTVVRPTFAASSTCTLSPMNALPPSFHEVDPVVMSQAMDHLQHAITSSAQLIADASADVAAEAAEPSNGWWQQYISLYRAALLGIHDAIDGPLRGVGITQTWGISIAIFTASIRGLLVPLSIQQTKSTEKMKALKPYQDEIREKFAKNKDAMNRALAKLFEDSGTNPLAGCLVSLLQLPVFLGLYRGVTTLAREGKLQEPFLWIPSLEGPVTAPTYRGMDWLVKGWTFDGSFPTPPLGWETTLAFVAMPIILVLGQSLTMNVLTPPPDENASEEEKEQMEKSQLILKFLPLMIGYFSLQVPAGLTIYWLTSNSFTLLQSLAVRAYYNANPPEINLPEYWDSLDKIEEMSPEDRRAAAEAGLSTGPNIQDLLDQARFHYVVMRTPIRDTSEAWDRVKLQKAHDAVPSEMAEWVAQGGSHGTAMSAPAAEPVETTSTASS